MRKVLIGMVAAVALSGCSSIPGISGLFPAPSLTGEWVVTRPSYSAFNMTLFEDNGDITGSSDSSAVTGTRSGNKVSITIKLTKSAPVYAGEISADGKKITGTIDGDGVDTFVANKKS